MPKQNSELETSLKKNIHCSDSHCKGKLYIRHWLCSSFSLSWNTDTHIQLRTRNPIRQTWGTGAQWNKCECCAWFGSRSCVHRVFGIKALTNQNRSSLVRSTNNGLLYDTLILAKFTRRRYSQRKVNPHKCWHLMQSNWLNLFARNQIFQNWI